MKPRNKSFLAKCIILTFGLPAAVISPFGSHTAQAQTVTLTASDGFNATSWNTGTRWSDSTAPNNGNDTYIVENLLLRSPTTGGQTLTFAGDSSVVLRIIGDGADNSVGRFLIKSNGSSYTAAYELDGGLIDQANGGSNTGTVDGTIAVLSGGGLFGADNSGGSNVETLIVAADISGSGSLEKVRNGNVILSGDNTSYTGAFTLAAGNLRLGSANAVGGTTALNFEGGFLQYSSSNTTDLSALINSSAHTADVKINTNNQNVTFASSLGGAQGLEKSGEGVLTLSAANTFSGATTLQAGYLELGHADALSGTSALNFSEGVLQYSANSTADVSAQINAGTHDADVKIFTNGQNVTFASAMDLDGQDLDKRGDGTLTLSAANTYANTLIKDGEVRAAASGALGSGTVVLGGGSEDGRLELTGGSTLSNNMTLSQRLTGNNAVHIQNVSGNNQLSGTLTGQIGGQHVRIESAAGTLTLSGTVTANASGRDFYFQGAGDGVVSGVINNGGGGGHDVFKEGTGSWTFSGANTYTGATNVNAGTLVINGNISTSSLTTVTGGTLQGSGVVGDLTATGGVIAPGNSIESLGVGNVSIGAGAGYAYELDSAALNGDLLYSSGMLSLASGSILTLEELTSGTLNMGDKLTLISYTGAWNNGLFEYLGGTLADDSTFILGSNEWLFNYDDTTGGSNFSGDQSGATGFVTMTVVPESSAALLGGLGMLVLLRRRRS